MGLFGDLLGDSFLPKITNVNEAREAYSSFYQLKDSDKREFSLQEWNRLYLPQVQKTTQDNDVNAFFRMFTSGNMPPSGEARDVARASLDFFVSMILTPKQAREIYGMFPYNEDLGCRTGHGGKITERWNDLSLLEVEKANSVAEIKVAVVNSFYRTSSFVKGMLKWIDACRTVGEVNDLLNYSIERNSDICRINSSVSQSIRKKIDSLLLSETSKVTDVETIKFYYGLASGGSAIEIFVFEKWLDLCTTPEEVNEAFIHAPKGKVACQLKAYTRMKNLASTIKTI